MSNYVVMPKADWQNTLDAVREKNGSADLYTSDQVGSVIRSIESAQSTLQVTTTDNATVTITKDGQTYTANGPVATFENLQSGVWTVTAADDNITKTTQVEIGYHKVNVYPVKIVGICRDITSAATAWERTDEAVGLAATASIGTVAGQSDFDDIYPWSAIQRETLATGDVMVKIPRFYYQRYRNGNMEYIRIANAPTDGFALHPLFIHAGVESDCVYVGAYKTSSDNMSVSGKYPKYSTTRAAFRTNAKSKGDGWGLIDIAAVSAIQMLILVEYANNDVQTVIGRGRCDSNIGVNTGSCDGVPNLTGRPAGTDGTTDIIWRGIEGFWGNLWECVDGVNINSGTYYVCNDPSKYADDTTADYAELSFVGSTSWSLTYITEEGIDYGNPHVLLPSVASGGSETTYLCDPVWMPSGWAVYQHGGCYDRGSASGMFTVMALATATTLSMAGSRLLYIPQEVV